MIDTVNDTVNDIVKVNDTNDMIFASCRLRIFFCSVLLDCNYSGKRRKNQLYRQQVKKGELFFTFETR